jgi:hypothetical protein
MLDVCSRIAEVRMSTDQQPAVVFRWTCAHEPQAEAREEKGQLICETCSKPISVHPAKKAAK